MSNAGGSLIAGLLSGLAKGKQQQFEVDLKKQEFAIMKDKVKYDTIKAQAEATKAQNESLFMNELFGGGQQQGQQAQQQPSSMPEGTEFSPNFGVNGAAGTAAAMMAQQPTQQPQQGKLMDMLSSIGIDPALLKAAYVQKFTGIPVIEAGGLAVRRQTENRLASRGKTINDVLPDGTKVSYDIDPETNQILRGPYTAERPNLRSFNTTGPQGTFRQLENPVSGELVTTGQPGGKGPVLVEPSERDLPPKAISSEARKQIAFLETTKNNIDQILTRVKPDFLGAKGALREASGRVSGFTPLASDPEFEAWKTMFEQAQMLERHEMFGATMTVQEKKAWQNAFASRYKDKEAFVASMKEVKRIIDDKYKNLIKSTTASFNEIQGGSGKPSLNLGKDAKGLRPGDTMTDIDDATGQEATKIFWGKDSKGNLVWGTVAPAIPPEAVKNLVEGKVTTFPNGQKWALENGVPRREK